MHAHNTGHKPLRNEVNFIDRDPNYFTRRVKEAIHTRLHPHNTNRDSGLEIPEAWMPRSKNTTTGEPCDSGPLREHITKRPSKDRNVPIRAVEKQLITAEHHAL